MKLNEALHVFRTELAADGLYDSLFGGMYQLDWVVTVLKGMAYGSALMALILVSAQAKYGRSLFGKLSLFLSLQAFICFALLLNHPVDEVFISLRHAMHLRDVGLFSFNRLQPIEGIVDFLPYATIGLLAKLGLPIVEMAFLQSILGGLLVILAGRKILQTCKIEGWKLSLGVWSLSLFPSNIFNATIGFTANLFAAAILWGLYFLLLAEKSNRARVLGLTILSLVPLIRLEGAFLVGLALLLELKMDWGQMRAIPCLRKFMFTSMAVLLPLLVLESFRLHTYGALVPLPIAYKASFGSWFFLREGLHAFWNDLLSTYAAASVAIALYLSSQFKDETRSTLLGMTGILFAAVVPYYLSGGDWFPNYWARYLLPFSAFGLVFALVYVLRSLETPHLPRLASALTVLIGIYAYFPSSLPKMVEQSRSWWAGHGNFRIQQLSRLGNHLRRNSAPNDVIASSEVATVMYYAEREALDLLGVANPKFIGRPLIERTLYRRRYPELVAETQPEFLYPGDFVSTEIGYGSTRREIAKEIDRLETMHAGWNEFFLGGLSSVRGAGYQPVLVIFGNRFSSLYFVSSSAFSRHVTELKANGFSQDTTQRIALK